MADFEKARRRDEEELIKARTPNAGGGAGGSFGGRTANNSNGGTGGGSGGSFANKPPKTGETIQVNSDRLIGTPATWGTGTAGTGATGMSGTTGVTPSADNSYLTNYQNMMSDYNQSVDDATKNAVAGMNAMRDSYNAYADKQLAANVASAKTDAESQLKQAYVQKLQNQRNLDNQLTQAGIRGGATETANLNLANQYGNARNSIYASRDKNITDLTNAAEQNKFNYGLDMDSRILETQQNAESEKRQNQKETATNIANWGRSDYEYGRSRSDQLADTQSERDYQDSVRREGYAREDAQRAEEKQTQEWTNKWASYTDPQKVLAALKAKNPDGSYKLQGEERSIAQARYGALKESNPEIQAYNQYVTAFTPNAEARVSAINSPKGVKTELAKWKKIVNKKGATAQEKAEAQAYINACYTRYGYLTGVDYATAQKQLENMK